MHKMLVMIKKSLEHLPLQQNRFSYQLTSKFCMIISYLILQFYLILRITKITKAMKIVISASANVLLFNAIVHYQ